MSNWNSPEKVITTIRQGDEAEFARGKNRLLVNKAANNEPLIDEVKADKIGMKIRNRWGEEMIALAHAMRQYQNNFSNGPQFFTVTIPKAPQDKADDWAGYITERINFYIKEGDRFLDYYHLDRYRWSGVVTHGVGAVLWEDRYDWLARYVSQEDFRVATDTEVGFRNLVWFGIRIPYTPGELSRKAFSKAKGKYKWDTQAVSEILRNVKEVNDTMAQNNYDINTMPEKFEELRKQNAGYWAGDAMPTINLWHFYHENDDGQWELKVVPDDTTTSSMTGAENNDKFICQSLGPIADTWKQLINVQFGDLNSKAPFMFHSVRSLGFALYESCYWLDFTRCRVLQHLHDSLNILLRITDPVDRARAQIQVFKDLGVLKPGVSIVPANERHQVAGALIDSVMGQLNQLQQEASASYTQQVDNGSAREQTAFETGVRVQQVDAMLSGLMATAGKYRKAEQMEICRRFCLKNTDDEDCKAFQKDCKDHGIPIPWMDVAKWIIDPVQPLGNGNPTMALVQAENALKLRPLLDPAAQSDALHDAAVQMVGSRRARAWVKTGQKQVSDASNAAANAFPLLLLGLPPQIPPGLNPIEQIQTLLGLSGGFIARIQQTVKVPTPDQLMGLQNVAAYLAKLIGGMAQDTGNKPKFKEFEHDLMMLTNEIKKLGAALNAQMQKSNGQGQNGEAAAKVQAINAQTQAKVSGQTAMTKVKLAAKQAADEQKLKHKDVGFAKDQQRQDFKTANEVGRNRLRKPLEE